MILLLGVEGLTDFKFFIEYAWYYYSIANLVPMLCVVLYKMWYPINWHDDYLTYKRTLDDKYIRIFCNIAVLYYFTDTIYLILRQAWLEACPNAFFTHHIIYLVFSYWANNPKYFTWFHALIPAWHNLLMAFPEYFFLSIIYIFILIIAHLGFFVSPFRHYKNPYVFLQIGFLILYYPMILLALGGCENIFYTYDVYLQWHRALVPK